MRSIKKGKNDLSMQHLNGKPWQRSHVSYKVLNMFVNLCVHLLTCKCGVGKRVMYTLLNKEVYSARLLTTFLLGRNNLFTPFILKKNDCLSNIVLFLLLHYNDRNTGSSF